MIYEHFDTLYANVVTYNGLLGISKELTKKSLFVTFLRLYLLSD